MTDVGGDEPSAARRPEVQRGRARDKMLRSALRLGAPLALASGAWLSSRRAEAAAEARPTYIFFYGSCISAESRARTGLSGTCLPCSVLGFERTWSATVDLAKLNCVTNPAVKAVTAVSAQAKPDARCNGVIVEVPEAELSAFDTREVGYARTPIAPELVKIDAPRCLALGLPISLPENAQVFIYIHPEGAPTAAAPVIQSYLDVMLLGCSEYGEAFATDFLRTTKGWGKERGAFVDDRALPAYVRASEAAAARAARWDELLKAECPEALGARVKV